MGNDGKSMSNKVYPAATVVLVRDMGDELQTLLLRRSANMRFAGGAWVFPGGRIDPRDWPATADASKRDTFPSHDSALSYGADEMSAAKTAAVRETQEEAGLVLDASSLLYFAHWTTPENYPKRFSTWFFVAPLQGDSGVRVDGGEIESHIWIAPAAALREHDAGNIELIPPTFITLLWLAQCGGSSQVMQQFSQRPPRVFLPRIVKVDGGYCSLYQEDEGYHDGDPGKIGRRHRCWMVKGQWRYEEL